MIDMRMDGRCALITGASKGIGYAAAVNFIKAGGDVAIVARRPDVLEEARASIAEEGKGKVIGIAGDVSKADDCARIFAEAEKALGRIDVLVNNAGGQFAQPAIDFSVKGWKAVIDTNLNGTWYMMQAAARRWRDHAQAGNIVNVTATVGRGLPHMAHSTAARAGVIYLSKTVAVEWAPLGIRVNCLGVGAVESSGFEQYTEEGRKTFYESNPMRRPGDVWDVVEGCVYLAGPSGKFITGEVLTIDGGQQMWGDFWSAGRPDYFKIG